MNKRLKCILIAVMIFTVIFALGCTKVVLEDEYEVYNTGIASSSKSLHVRPAIYSAGSDGASYELSADSYAKPAYYSPPEERHYGSGDDIDTKTLIIRTAYLDLEVADYFLASQKVEAYAKKYDGYVSNSNSNADDINKYSGTITLRVPEMHFDAVMAELSLLGEIKSKDTGGNDVTEQYIDLQSRINNSKAHEERLVEMYASAKNVKEMLSVERELSRVRGEIESMQGSLRYLSDRVSMSTVTVYLYEQTPVVKEWGVWESMKNAVNHFLSTLRFLIELIGWLLPLILSAGIIWAIVKLVRRGGRRIKRR